MLTNVNIKSRLVFLINLLSVLMVSISAPGFVGIDKSDSMSEITAASNELSFGIEKIKKEF